MQSARLHHFKQTLTAIMPKPFIKGTFETGKVSVYFWKYGTALPLTPKDSLKLINHSPTGFGWGYAGSGPAQLALALLLLICPKQHALALYQRFKFDVISTLPQADFELDIESIERWVQDHV